MDPPADKTYQNWASHIPTIDQRRETDHGFLCTIALRFSQLWDFIDKRDIDKHTMSWAVFGITCYMLYWSMEFVWSHPDKPGLEVGAIVAALMLPWTPVQAKVIQWYFDSRTEK